MQKLNITIKSYMILFLIILGLFAIFTLQRYDILFQLAFAPLVTAIIDVAINLVKIRKLVLPSSAIISGLFIGLILPPLSPVLTVALAALIAIISKHIIKFHGRHIFNPAAFGIVISGLIFGIAAAWWGTSLLVVPLGLFIVYKQRKWFLVLPFIITYYIMLILLNIQNLATISFVDTTLLFFAFLMLLEPMTSAYTKKAVIAHGIIVAMLAIIVSRFIPGIDVFLIPLLIGNIFVETLNKKLR